MGRRMTPGPRSVSGPGHNRQKEEKKTGTDAMEMAVEVAPNTLYLLDDINNGTLAFQQSKPITIFPS